MLNVTLPTDLRSDSPPLPHEFLSYPEGTEGSRLLRPGKICSWVFSFLPRGEACRPWRKRGRRFPACRCFWPTPPAPRRTMYPNPGAGEAGPDGEMRGCLTLTGGPGLGSGLDFLIPVQPVGGCISPVIPRHQHPHKDRTISNSEKA